MADDGLPSVEVLYGPILIGMFFSTILYGVTVVQIFLYFARYKDPAWIRYLVIYLFMVETLSTAFCFEMVYEPLIRKAGLPDIKITSPLLLAADGPVTAMIATPVQLLMAWRIKVITQSQSRFKIISGSTIMPLIIAIFSVASLAGGIWLGIRVARQPRFEDFAQFKGASVLWLVSTAVADVLIAGAMVLSLIRRKSSFQATNNQIDRILRLTVQTGTLTAVAALADSILFLILPHTTLFFIWDLSLSKLYTNSILSSLNARPWSDPNRGQPGTTTSLLFANHNLNAISGSSTSISLNDVAKTGPRVLVSVLTERAIDVK
ncbi:hypothetical protein E1B28_002239 [Marasmius oreades]|uniref:DUF6534 domain-containing protein n=1 Tax=Marasmius oreades TaxID=181124 RepID=A0A9P7RMG4_9AGAR|nr:uncharacterized protein E1B28_002239 [Marasmius oreades]KAG7086274.1 hypothetical protein E1B28_002239 [Marasmius oreades]